MVRKRLKKSKAEAAFTSGARKVKGLDPKAPKLYKSLTLQMNEYEYTRFVQAAESAERGMLDFLRRALKKAITEEIGD